MKFIGKVLLFLLAIIFPFVVFFLRDKPAAALVALFLQCTAIGWPIAIIWAFKNLKPKEDDETDNDEAANES